MQHEFFPSIPDRRFQKRADFATTGTHRNADQMSPDSATKTDEPIVPAEEWVRPRASNYLWRPWYAKLWWAAIPIYWLPAGSPFGFDFLADFYRSEEHTSELQSLMRISYAVFCLKKNIKYSQ